MNPITIEITERHGITRSREPVSCGIPLARGEVTNPESLCLIDSQGDPIAASFTPLSRWHDNSIKWVLADFQVDVDACGTQQIKVVYPADTVVAVPECHGIEVEKTATDIRINTGCGRFELASSGILQLHSAQVSSHEALSDPVSLCLIDAQGVAWQPGVDSCKLERQNAHRLIVACTGKFMSDAGNAQLLCFKSRYHFFAGTGTIRIDFTIWNPQAAVHKQGVWDLGDAHSLFFKELLMAVPVAGNTECRYCATLNDAWHFSEDDLLIYQDSSGGENWQSPVHVNRHDEVPLAFRGYEVRSSGKVIARGKRATPVMVLEGDHTDCICTLPRFWQNFPKGLSRRGKSLSVHLFPGEFSDLHELQAGEQKTHTVFLHFGNRNHEEMQAFVASCHQPLLPHVESEQYYLAGLAPRPVPLESVADDSLSSAYQEYIDTAIHGERSFVRRREIIDEYGWRNFGEQYADHEAVMHDEDTLFISHYNNQYDSIKGGLFQFMRTGDPAWYRMASELADHVADIDIYRTDQDRYEYNNGLFWHTDHHVPACTATHRTTSEKHFALKDPRFVGGGPSYEHNYSTGFCYLYWMTGETPYRECALLFAGYIQNGLNGPDTLVEMAWNSLKRLKYTLTSSGSTQFGSPYGLLTGPGRGSGNALNTLVDAYLLTQETQYLQKAGWLIRKCVGPDDDIDGRDLLNAELRWMYLIFVQAMGRYLEVCVEREQWDADFHYARITFVRYAQWMLEHEYPYLDKPEILEFPNETWAAQDVRKADILALAARYGMADQREAFLRKASYFFSKTLEHVQRFGENSYLTRPLVVLMTNGLTWMEVTRNIQVDRLPAYDESLAEVGGRRKKEIEGRVLKKMWRIAGTTSLKKELAWLRNRLQSR